MHGEYVALLSNYLRALQVDSRCIDAYIVPFRLRRFGNR